eukprot:8570007-Prorocentrum_lima.AAC.1
MARFGSPSRNSGLALWRERELMHSACTVQQPRRCVDIWHPLQCTLVHAVTAMPATTTGRNWWGP